MLARFDVISLWRAPSTSRNRPSASIIGLSIMDITAPAWGAVIANLVAHRPQAYSQKLCSPRAVSARGFKRHLHQLALHIFQRNPGPQTVVKLALVLPRLPGFVFIPGRALQAFRADFRPRGQSYRAAQAVGQFAHVAGPGVSFEALDEF